MALLIEHTDDFQETVQDLREDAALLNLTLMGAQVSIDELTLNCLLRLTGYLQQHVNDLCTLSRKRNSSV